MIFDMIMMYMNFWYVDLIEYDWFLMFFEFVIMYYDDYEVVYWLIIIMMHDIVWFEIECYCDEYMIRLFMLLWNMYELCFIYFLNLIN